MLSQSRKQCYLQEKENAEGAGGSGSGIGLEIRDYTEASESHTCLEFIYHHVFHSNFQPKGNFVLYSRVFGLLSLLLVPSVNSRGIGISAAITKIYI